MPDWTYHPLRPIASGLLGQRRASRWAFAGAALLARTAFGRGLIRTVGGTRPPAEAARVVAGLRCPAPVAVRVGVAAAERALRVLPALGAGLIEIGPVGPADEPLLRAVLARRPPGVPVVLRPAEGYDPAGLAPLVDLVAVDGVGVAVDGPDAALLRLDAGADLVAVTAADLIAHGPGLPARITEAVVARGHPAPRDTWRANPRSWPAWAWAALVAAGMICGGLGAAAITLGPVLLWYDTGYLGDGVADLHRINARLVGFLEHDRITLAGTMVSLGVLYAALANGIRLGWDWARTALLVSGLVGFPTLFYFLAFGFVEPLHAALTVILLPMFVAAVWRRPPRRWRIAPDGPEPLRRRALVGQFLLVVVGVGVAGAGVVISAVGLTEVFVPSDLVFLRATRDGLHAANDRLVGFIAHDRAGFGGVLMAAGVVIVWSVAHGWRRGARWLWWGLAVSAAAAWLPALVIHLVVGYTDFLHLLPVFVGLGLSAVALALARPYLCARPGPGPGSAPSPASR